MDERRARFDTLVLPHLDVAYRYARQLCKFTADADDLLQEAILRAFRAFDSLRGSEARPWLLAIVRNCHATAYRQDQMRAQVPLPEEHDPIDGHAMVADVADPLHAAINHDDNRTLQRLIGTLSDEHREVLLLREIEDMDYREIATVTGLPMGTVMSRLARARTALKMQWSREFGEPRAVS